MRHKLQLVAFTLITTVSLYAQFHMPQLSHKEKDTHDDASWLAPFANPAPNGRGADLIHDARFKAFVRDNLTARQTFWNDNESLSDTVLEFLGVPNQVTLDNNRYLSVDGCVPAFCPARGLFFVDLGVPHPLVVFAALDWVKEDKTPSQDGAEFTLWVFSNRSFQGEQAAADAPKNDSSTATTYHIPKALTTAIARWSAQPVPGSSEHQNISRAVIVEPDGAGRQVTPAAIGATSSPQSETKVNP